MVELQFSNPALERMRILAKGQKGAALVALIKQAVTSQGVYVFGELLSLPNIEELQNGPHAPYYRLLQLFAYGCLSDHNPSQHPELEPAARRKLQLLTIVRLAGQHKSIDYDALFTALQVENVRELEDLVIESIYAGLVRGKLDQKARTVKVASAGSRDIESGDMNAMADTLHNWSGTCHALLGTIESQVLVSKERLDAHVNHSAQLDTRVEELKRAIAAEEKQIPITVDTSIGRTGALGKFTSDLGISSTDKSKRSPKVKPTSTAPKTTTNTNAKK